MNRVYFIGAGPGSPDHLTLQGARCLERCHSVFAVPPYEELFSELLDSKKIFVPFDYYFRDLVDKIDALRREGPVAFLIPGDLTFYSPFQSLIDHFADDAVVVPGIGTANAASAHLKKTLDLPGICNRAVLVSPRTLGNDDNAPTLAQLAAPGATLIIYMNNLPLDELVRQLRQGYSRNVPIAILHRLELPGEEVVTGTLDDIVDKVGDRDFFNLSQENRRPALTLVIVGETLAAEADAAWWDYRRDHIWRAREGRG
ncbi:MAG: hypothetical protein GWO11_06750 [Desulfuromonadales bacterium]|nr:hypothetical protein [Desulfuromonadales bacterium]NIR34048.1 hypothetical protein [Desulfuromonadales bacterium]NIS44099.1 hypothetical protein [Desulfuromonadales bacterium]